MNNLGLFSYAAAQGYIRARISRLIDGATWSALLQAASEAQIAHLLFEPEVARSAAGEHRISGQALRGQLAASAHALIRFVPRRPAELLAWYNRRFEIENLKIVLRAVHYRLDRARTVAALIPLPNTNWRWEQLAEAASIPALIDRIRDSPYSRPLENALERYHQEGRLFYLEVAVDLFYFQRLVRLIEAQTGKDARDARDFLGQWIGVQNLVWAYRYRIYGRMTPEEIINFTLHRAFAVSLDTVRRVALGSPLAVEAERVGFLVPAGVSEVEALTALEMLADRERFRFALRSVARPMFSLGGALAYLRLLEAEVRDVAVILEGKQAGLTGAEIAPRLIRAA